MIGHSCLKALLRMPLMISLFGIVPLVIVLAFLGMAPHAVVQFSIQFCLICLWWFTYRQIDFVGPLTQLFSFILTGRVA
eukprot:51935-Ditylum_brightwellii.AAC.1